MNSTIPTEPGLQDEVWKKVYSLIDESVCVPSCSNHRFVMIILLSVFMFTSYFAFL